MTREDLDKGKFPSVVAMEKGVQLELDNILSNNKPKEIAKEKLDQDADKLLDELEEKYSNCCDAAFIPNSDICSKCQEHAGVKS